MGITEHRFGKKIEEKCPICGVKGLYYWTPDKRELYNMKCQHAVEPGEIGVSDFDAWNKDAGNFNISKYRSSWSNKKAEIG